jgi:hypothetical protein
MKVGFFLSRRLTKRDLIRFGINTFYPNNIIFDFSNLFKHRSQIFQKKKLKLKNYYLIESLKELRFLIKKNNIKYAVDFLEGSINDFIIRLYLRKNKIKLIKYLVGLKPEIQYQTKKNFKKKFNYRNLFTIIKKKIIKIFFSKLYWLILITGKKYKNYENLIHKKILKIFTHNLDYNNYLYLRNKSKKKNIVTFIDQNLSYHQDFYIKKNSPIVTPSDYYKKIFNYFKFIETKYNTKVVIAAHPKKGLKNPFLKNCRYKIYHNKTPSLISESRFVIMHYSTAVSYCVLFKKPIIFITNNELNKKRAGFQIKTLSKELGSKLLNIDKNLKKINVSINLIKYQKFKYNYLKYPNTEDKNSWDVLKKFLLKI